MIQLFHGDCLELMKNISTKSVDMILCDLPYGTTACKWDVVIPFDPLWEQYKRIIKDNGAIVLFGSEPFSSRLRMSNIKMFKYDWVWEKTKASGFLNARHAPLRAHEIISVFSNCKTTYHPQFITGGKPYKKLNVTDGATTVYGKIDKTGIVKESKDGRRYPRSVMKFSNGNYKSLHPTQKPVPLLEYLIRTYTNEGDIVLDNCMGSGSTGVACVNLNRNFIGMELNEEYFQIAKERIQKAQAEPKQISLFDYQNVNELELVT